MAAAIAILAIFIAEQVLSMHHTMSWTIAFGFCGGWDSGGGTEQTI